MMAMKVSLMAMAKQASITCMKTRGLTFHRKIPHTALRCQRLTRSSTMSNFTSQASTGIIKWPPSFNSFISGTPIVTNKLPGLGVVEVDFGTVMMNFGAITSLSGFMMSDVIYLRALSIVGSSCSLTYNITRVPKQLNAVTWCLVFIAVNVFKIVQVLMEREEIHFSVEEADFFHKNFESFGVEPKVFKNLMESLGSWQMCKPGDIIVPDGKPLDRVIILVNGRGTAHNVNGEALYSYSSTENGKIVGATGLVDRTILGRAYPNTVIAAEPTRILAFDTKKLSKFLESNDNSVKAAFLNMVYIDLIGSLRRNRNVGEQEKGMGMALHDLKTSLQQACADGVIHSTERRLIRKMVEKHGIDESQFNALLGSTEIGWTKEEWKDGAKQSILDHKEATVQEPT